MKKNNTRLVICIALIALISASILLGFFLIRLRTIRGNANSNDQIAYKARYAFICGDPENDIFKAVYDSAKQRGEEKGEYVEFMGSEFSGSYSAIDLMDMAIDAGMDGIIVEPSSGSRQMTRYIDRAVDAGIPVVTLGNDDTESRRNAYVGFASYSVGQSFGRQIVSFKGEETKNVTVLMNAGGNNSDIIYSGIRNSIESEGLSDSFFLTAQFIDDSQPYSAEEGVSQLLKREEIPDVIICLDETITSCACQAIVDLNRVGETTILGFYVNSAILAAINNGILYSTVVMDARKMGEYCVDTLDSFRESEVVNEYIPVETYVIDKTNIDEYYSESSPE